MKHRDPTVRDERNGGCGIHVAEADVRVFAVIVVYVEQVNHQHEVREILLVIFSAQKRCKIRFVGISGGRGKLQKYF